MKKIFSLIIMVMLVGMLFSQKVVLRVAYEDKEQPPYYMVNSSEVPKVNPGISVETVQLLAKYIPELEIEFQRFPWRRCTYLLGQNAVDAIFNSSYVPDRLELGWYPTKDKTHRGEVDTSRRITTIAYNFYTLKDSGFKWDGDFSKITDTIGAPLGYSIVGDLNKVGIKTEEAPDSNTNLAKLNAKRLNAVVLQDVTADAILQNNPQFSNIVKLEPPVVAKEYYLMLSAKFVQENPVLAQKIWDTIAVIRENEIPKMLSRYAN